MSKRGSNVGAEVKKPHLGTHVVLLPGSATKSQSSFPLVATTVSPLICIDTSRC